MEGRTTRLEEGFFGIAGRAGKLNGIERWRIGGDLDGFESAVLNGYTLFEKGDIRNPAVRNSV
jgi:hypothetical protein